VEYKMSKVAYTWQCDGCDYAGNGDDITDAQNHANNEQHTVTVGCTSTYKVIP
jgi:hypothetical protein